MHYSRLFIKILLLAGGLLWAVSASSSQAFAAGGGPGDSFGGGDDASGVSVTAQFTAPAAGRPGQLFVTATMQPGWHIYSLTQKPGGPLASKIDLTPPNGVRVSAAFEPSPPPVKKTGTVFGDLLVETHEGTVTWHAPLELAPGVDPASLATLAIPGRLNVQACNEQGCFPPRDYAFTAKLGHGVALAGAPEAAPERAPATPPKNRSEAASPANPKSDARSLWQPFTTIAALGELVKSGFDPKRIEGEIHQQFVNSSPLEIAGYIVAGFLGGLILNIMPCVLPVIGLKLLSFVEQSGHDRRKALVLNVWYSLGLMSVFFVLATLAVSPKQLGWGQLFSYTGFTISLAAVVFVMGLSFLGVWELPIPGFAGRGKAGELAAKEGATGAFVKGALTTVLATPCTAPFLGTALAWAVAQPPQLTYAVLLSAGLGMASPYLLIGAFPQLIRFLPKPGAWMDTFKQSMGFLLLGTVVYIFTFLELPLVVPTLGLLFALWAACWWIGRISPLAEPGARARAWLEAAAFAGVVWIFMFPGLGRIAGGSLAFDGLADVMRDRFDRQVHRRASLIALDRQPEKSVGRKTVLVDFTADWCPTCKVFEATVLNTATITDAVRKNGVVTLQADWTHAEDSPEVTRMLETLGCKEIPVLAIFPAGDPNRPIVFRGGCTQQTLLDALEKAGPSKL